MIVRRLGRSAVISWASLAAIAALSLALGILQYRFLGEVSRAERERLQSTLQTSLNRLREDFSAELNAACASLVQSNPAATLESRARAVYSQLRAMA